MTFSGAQVHILVEFHTDIFCCCWHLHLSTNLCSLCGIGFIGLSNQNKCCSQQTERRQIDKQTSRRWTAIINTTKEAAFGSHSKFAHKKQQQKNYRTHRQQHTHTHTRMSHRIWRMFRIYKDFHRYNAQTVIKIYLNQATRNTLKAKNKQRASRGVSIVKYSEHWQLSHWGLRVWELYKEFHSLLLELVKN